MNSSFLPGRFGVCLATMPDARCNEQANADRAGEWQDAAGMKVQMLRGAMLAAGKQEHIARNPLDSSLRH